MPNAPLIGMQAIVKTFAGVRVLDRVSFDIWAGETHVLAGENGAGKSTLMKILCGVYADYDGAILLNGRRVRLLSPHHATSLGIAMIHQELSLIPTLSVVDNIFLGRERVVAGGWMQHRRQRKEARDRLRQLNLDLDVTRPVGDFPVSIRQMIEIAKALAFESRILIMDEPTSALNETEAQRLFDIIRSLRGQGCGIVYISHKLDEMYKIGDRLSVLRDGRNIVSALAKDLAPQDLVRSLVGRDIGCRFPERQARPGPTRIAVEGLSLRDPSNSRRMILERISFSARAGEILGFAGLQGSGANELFQALFGVYGRIQEGKVSLDERPVIMQSPGRALNAGLAYLTNDRKANGLASGMSIVHNMTLASLRRYSAYGWMEARREWEAALVYRDKLHIRMRSPAQEAQELSGGNQQKVLIARWLECLPKVLLLDEPTRGVDVGAKHDLYELMNQWTAEGLSIMLITSELPELLAMADRVIVMHRGRICARYARDAAAPDRVMRAAMGDACA